jgi:hypothetical protein
VSRTHRWSFWAVTLLFLASRLYVLFWADILGSTIGEVNVVYALTFQRAIQEGVPFYAEIENVRHHFADSAQYIGPAPQPIEFRVEYPPLAIEWMRIPNFLQPRPSEDATPVEIVKQAVLSSRALSACVDLLGFVLLALMLPKIFPGESALRESLRLLLYAGGGMILFNLLYDRLDLPVGVLLLAGLFLLVGRVHYAASFIVLALAINFKLTPGMVLPIWILGSMPAAALAGRLDKARWARLAGLAAVRLTCIGLFTAAIFLPYYMKWGEGTLDFLEYHARRGIQIESVWATAVLLAGRLFGSQPQVLANFGATHLQSPAANLLAAISPLVSVLLLALATISFWISLRRRLSGVQPGSSTMAQVAPDLMVGYTVLFLFLGMASAKVLSPQYLLWLVPLMPLLAWDSKLIKWLLVGYLGMLGLTTAIFPYLYDSLITPALLTQPTSLRLPPRALGLCLLLARNLLLLAVGGGTWVLLRRGESMGLDSTTANSTSSCAG